MSSLGRVPGVPGAYSDLTRHPENIAVPGTLILRLDAPIYYANALTVREKVKTMVEEYETEAPLHAVIIDSTSQDELDVTSMEMLKGLIKELKNKGVAIYVAELHTPVREFIRQNGLLDLIGEQNIFQTVDLAVSYIESQN